MLDDDEPLEEEPTAAPRWAKVFAAVALVVVVGFVVLLAFGGGHGPQRHRAAAHAAA